MVRVQRFRGWEEWNDGRVGETRNGGIMEYWNIGRMG